MLLVITGDRPVIHGRKRRTRTLELLSRFAHANRVQMVVVTPYDIAYRHGIPVTADGWQLDVLTSDWKRIKANIDRPVWIDFMYLQDLKRHRLAYRRLKTAITRSGQPCSNPSFPGKDHVYRRLAKKSLKPACIPETQTAESVNDILQTLNKKSVVWLKPTRGSGGRNIVRIAVMKNGLILLQSDFYHGKQLHQTVKHAHLVRFLRSMLANKAYMIQEEVDLPRTKDGRRIDVRVTVQRDDGGQWCVTATTIRRSAAGALVTNFHGGGTFTSMASPNVDALLSGAGITRPDIKRAELAAIRVAKALQSDNPTLAFLGIDVAPGPSCCYVYDCNTKPGRDILTDAEVRLMMQRLAGFAAFIQRTRYPNS
ncbi:YheC/YheD family protein [Alicyclobacillus dauci]|uniref:YheC/YheD family protein n=1 Tax=Alicyclobacillus dauci TaxID=1475485 RepID=A0ABY6YZR6_9BACL|nr:YheC/YheD family protein [Alicyclobacillus dauci]WAH36128.1 YheC/YheD family protein [Alicyclobacillus dauci]